MKQGVKRLTNRSDYREYRHSEKIDKKHSISNRDEYLSFVRWFYKTIRKNMLERDSGVLINDFGYFFNFMIPAKSTLPAGDKERYYPHSDYHVYFPAFIPHRKYMGWTMDKTFGAAYLNEMKKNLRRGKKYKHYVGTLKRMKAL